MMMKITKRYLDRFIRFCRTHGIVQQTNTQKDTHTHRDHATSDTTSRIYEVRARDEA